MVTCHGKLQSERGLSNPFTMASVEALCSIAHVASEDEVRGSLQRLSSRARRTSLGREVGILACQRAIRSNPDVGVCRAFLEQPEIRRNINYVCDNNPSGGVPTTLLHAAVLRPTPDGEAIARMLLALPEVDLNLVSRDGLSPLHLACWLSRHEVVELLLHDRRVDLGAKTLDHRTALHCACGDAPGFGKTSWGASSCRKWGVVRILLRAAATSSESLVCFLNERDNGGRTALHYASEKNHTAIVQGILDARLHAVADALPDHVEAEHVRNAAVLAEDSRGRLPIHWAAQKGHREVARLLLSSSPRTLHCRDSEALTPLHHVVRGGHLHILQDWVSQCVPKSASESLEQQTVKTFMELLKIASHYEVAEFLLEELDQQLQASSPSRRNATSLLHWAVESRSGCGGLVLPQILKWQPQLANDVLDQDRNQTPLHVSTLACNLDVVEALCTEQGWSLQANKRDKFDKTALDYAYALGHEDVCERLMQRSDVKECISMLQKEQDMYVTAANAILVVAVLMAGATYASCVKPLSDSDNSSTRFSFLYVIVPTTFLASVAATVLGACAALPFSFGLYVGKHVKRCDYIGLKVRRIRVLVVLASYFLLLSLATMVFSFLCSVFGMGTYLRTRLMACAVFTVAFLGVSLVAFVTYFSRAIYYRVKQLSWRTRKSFTLPVIVSKRIITN